MNLLSIVKGGRGKHVGMNALRVVAMLMICILHSIYPQNPEDSGYNLLMSFMHSISVAGVNLFVLMTGFFLVDKKWSFVRYAHLWYSVLFYTICFIILFYILDKAGISSGIYDFGMARFHLVQMMFGSCYWFFAAYTALYLLIPFLNRAINNMDQRMYFALILVTAGVIPIMNIGCFAAIYGGGNVCVWFVVLYLVGAYMRIYPVKVPNFILLLVLAICILIPTAVKSTIDSAWIFNAVGGLSSPFVILCSISIFVLFSRWECSRFACIAKLLSIMSSLTFGVYLIHVHPFVFKWLLGKVEIWYRELGYNYFVPIAMAFGIYIGCSAIEWGRVVLFRLLRLDSKLDAISAYVESGCVGLFNRAKESWKNSD